MSPLLKKGLIGLLALAVCWVYGSWVFRAKNAEASEEPTSPVAFPEEQADTGPRPAPVLVPKDMSEGLYDVGQWRGKPALCDLNEDGNLDLVAALRRWDHDRPGEGIYVWLGNGKGSWRTSLKGLRRDMGYGGSAVGEVNGDGALDIAFSGHDTMPQAFLGDSTGFWKENSDGIFSEGPCADITLGDLDGDGRDELLSMGFFPDTGGLFAFQLDDEGRWQLLEKILDKQSYGAQVHVMDIEADGTPEIVAATDQGPRVWSWEGGAVERSEGLPPSELGGSDLAIDSFDLDGDGVLELIVAGMNYPGHPPLVAYRWDGEKWNTYGNGLPDDEAFWDVRFAQLDGEGMPEVVAAGKHGISVITITESGDFERIGRVDGTSFVINLTAGDINADGRDEIATVGFEGVQVLSLDLAGSL